MSNLRKKAVLVLDIGTSFVKIGLFDLNANPIEGRNIKFEHWMTIKTDGTYTFNALESAQIIERGIDELISKSSEYEIIAFSTDTMASTIVGLDKNNTPVTDVFTYADTRPYRQLSKLKEGVNQKVFYDDTGCPMHTSYIPSRIIWFKEKYPEIDKKINIWTDFSNYLLRRWMQNKDIDISYSVASWTGLFNRKKLTWYVPGLNFIDLKENKLPNLSPYTKTVKGLNPEYSKRWAQLEKVPFFLPVGDGASSNIGVGCNSENKIALSIGTTGALRVLTNKSKINIPQGLWNYRLGENYNLLGGAFSEGGNVGLWLKKLMNIHPNADSNSIDEINESESNLELENMLLRSKPDSHGLTVLPFLAGERAVGWAENATGTLTGMRLSTTKAEIYQAFLEAIAYRFGLVSKKLMTLLQEDCLVVASGGAVQSSKYWLQMLADVLSMRVGVSNVPEDTGRGTAILALNAMGISKSFNDYDFEVSEFYDPNEKNMIAYQNAMNRQEELYSKIFN